MNTFFERRGFYIVLALCAVAIGASVYVNYPNESPDSLSDTKQIYETSENIVIPNEVVVAPPEIKNEVPSNVSDTMKANEPELEVTVPVEVTTEDVADVSLEVKVTKDEPLFMYPTSTKEVLQPNSNNELVKDLTMNDWRTHNATDYVVKEDENILAITDGVVKSITTSDEYGTVIEIEHSEGLITKTYGLKSETTVKVEDNVVAGDVIGVAQGVILFEQKLGEHIHIEATKNGENFDIETLQMQ